MKNFNMALLAMVLVVNSVLVAACSHKEEKKANAKDAKTEECTVQHAKGEIKIPAHPKKIAALSGSTEDLLIFGMTPIITATPYHENIHAHIEKKL